MQDAWPLEALPRGTTLNGYRIEGLLGRGGFGITYVAADGIDQKFALKECYPRQFCTREGPVVRACNDADAELLAECLDRFTKEARALTLFSTRDYTGATGMGTRGASGAGDGVVRVITYFEANATAYIVMELLDGEALDQVIADNPEGLPEPALGAILQNLLPALGAVHESGLLHRDIKPANIFVRRNGRPVLLDFGAARAQQTGCAAFTQIYSENYAPIEQIEGAAQGPYSDIYALGVTCYQAIAGKQFKAGGCQSSGRHMAILRKQPDPLVPAVEIGAGRYDPRLLAGIDAALSVAPQDRPQNVHALMQALGLLEPARAADPDATVVARSGMQGPAGRGQASTLRETAGSSAATRSATMQTGTPPITAPPKAPGGSGTAVLVIGTLLILGVAAGAAYVLTNKHSGQQAAYVAPPASDGVRAEHGSSANPAGAMMLPPDPAPAAPRAAGADLAFRRGEYLSAFEAYRSAAEAGDAAAQYQTGYMSQLGLGTPPDARVAKSWYDKSAAQHFPAAQNQLGFLYQTGAGVQQDYAEAVRWYTLAAAQGFATAAYQLGYLAQHGLGQSRNYTLARTWYLQAAQQGSAPAQQQLGYLAQMGLGMHADYADAMRWYRQAAGQRLPAAMFSVGHLYAQGLGVPRDLAQARDWMTRAAAAGNAEGRAWLASH